MKFINADLDKLITIRDVMEALAESTEDYTGSGYFSYDCAECGHEDDCPIPAADAGTLIDVDAFEDSLVRRLDRSPDLR